MTEAVEHGFELARWAEDEVRRTPGAQVVSPAQMAMVNFRFVADGLTPRETDELNAEVSRRMVRSGYAGVFTTELSGARCLRICAIHPQAGEEDVRSTVRRLAQIRDELL